jgi:hypothetical protein
MLDCPQTLFDVILDEGGERMRAVLRFRLLPVVMTALLAFSANLFPAAAAQDSKAGSHKSDRRKADTEDKESKAEERKKKREEVKRVNRFREVIRDTSGQKIGEIREISSGRLEARDRHGRLVGRYDPRSNITRDRNGRLMTRGNTLTGLLMQADKASRPD